MYNIPLGFAPFGGGAGGGLFGGSSITFGFVHPAASITQKMIIIRFT